MTEHDLTDFKLQPDLRNGEEVLITSTIRYPNDNDRAEILAVTTERLCVRPRKRSGMLSPGGEGAVEDIELADVTVLRESVGLGGSILELESKDGIHTYENVTLIQQVSETIVDTTGVIPNWEEEETDSAMKKWVRITVGIASSLMGIGGAILGILFILAGVAASLTFVGLPVGVLCLLLGIGLLVGSGVAIAGGAMGAGISFVSEKKEWVRA